MIFVGRLLMRLLREKGAGGVGTCVLGVGAEGKEGKEGRVGSMPLLAFGPLIFLRYSLMGPKKGILWKV